MPEEQAQQGPSTSGRQPRRSGRGSCLECGKRKGWFAQNYAGLRFRADGNHPYPDRIEDTVLPGSRRTDFLCAACANKRKVRCSIHGFVATALSSPAAVPSCPKCFEEIEKRRITEMLAASSSVWIRGELGDASMGLGEVLLATQKHIDQVPEAAAWLALCHLLCAEKVNVDWTIHPAVGGDQSFGKPSWKESRKMAIELAQKAQRQLPTDAHGRKLLNAIEARANAITGPHVPLEELHTYGFTVLKTDEAAIFKAKIVDLRDLLLSLPGHEWLTGSSGPVASDARERPGEETSTPT